MSEFRKWHDAHGYESSITSVVDETGVEICVITPGNTPEYYDGVLAMQICDDHNQTAALRKALAGLVKQTHPIEFDDCIYCGEYEWDGHKPDCPWLVAKQLLEQEPPAQSGPEQEEQNKEQSE